MKKLTTFLILSTFMTFSILTMNGAVQAKTIELKFGHVGAPGSLFLACADEFAKRANAKLGDKAKVVTFGSSQLGKDAELLKKLRLGTIAFASAVNGHVIGCRRIWCFRDAVSCP